MKPSYEDLEEQLNRSRRLCDAALANERAWETTMMEACGEDGPASVASEIAALRANRDTALESLRQQLAAVVAENAGLKSAIEKHADSYIMCGYCRTERDGKNDDVCEVLDSISDTDAFLAEVRAQARNEGINYAAGRLAAAFNHGFVDKPLAEVCDVVRMILDTKEELANSTLPAADGLSGEYAEEFIENSIVELRKGSATEEKQSFLSDEDCHAFVEAFTKGAAQ